MYVALRMYVVVVKCRMSVDFRITTKKYISVVILVSRHAAVL